MNLLYGGSIKTPCKPIWRDCEDYDHDPLSFTFHFRDHIGAALSMTAGLAFAGDTVSAKQIVNALKPKPMTRGLSSGPQADPAVRPRKQFRRQAAQPQNPLALVGEREEIAQIASAKPNIDLEIHFDYNSADINKSSSRRA